MGMLPGFSNSLMPAGHEKESQAKIKRFMCIMDSMTDKELDSPEPKMLSVRFGLNKHGSDYNDMPMRRTI